LPSAPIIGAEAFVLGGNMDVKKLATEYHEKGFNCAQSVLCSCGEYTGLDEKTALAVSGGFGGGLRCGEICGAVSGAVMAAGLCCQYVDNTDLETKAKIAELAKYITGEFKEEYGVLRCVDLKKAGKPCAELIEYCAALTEKTINEIRTGEKK